MLSVQNLSKRFGNLRALEQVSFDIPDGCMTGVIGPNGAGKSTLLLSLAGFLPTDAGSIHWNRETVASRARFASIFFCVEDAVRPHAFLPVNAVLAFYASLFGRTRARREALTEQLTLEPFLRSRISELSKGAAKRFLIAIGLLSMQPVLMLDEPFDGLDLRQTMELVPLLRSSLAEGRTLVLSIHQLRDAERMCERFLLLNNGRLAGSGTLPELRHAARGVQGTGLEEIFLALT